MRDTYAFVEHPEGAAIMRNDDVVLVLPPWQCAAVAIKLLQFSKLSQLPGLADLERQMALAN